MMHAKEECKMGIFKFFRRSDINQGVQEFQNQERPFFWMYGHPRNIRMVTFPEATTYRCST